MNKTQRLQQLKTRKAAADRAALNAVRDWAEGAAANITHADHAAPNVDLESYDNFTVIGDINARIDGIDACECTEDSIDALADLATARAFLRVAINDVNDVNAADDAWAELDAPLNAFTATIAALDAAHASSNVANAVDDVQADFEHAFDNAVDAVNDFTSELALDGSATTAPTHVTVRTTARETLNDAYDAWVTLATALNAIEDTEAHASERAARSTASDALNVAVDAWADFATARTAKAAARPYDSSTHVSDADIDAWRRKNAIEDIASGFWPTRERDEARAALATIKAEATRKEARRAAYEAATDAAWHAAITTYNETRSAARDAARAAARAAAAADDAADACAPTRVSARATRANANARARAAIKAKAEADEANLPF